MVTIPMKGTRHVRDVAGYLGQSAEAVTGGSAASHLAALTATEAGGPAGTVPARETAVGQRPRRLPFAKPSLITKKGSIVSNIELPVLRKHAIHGKKRLRRVVLPAIAAATLTASLTAAAVPASAAVRMPARTAPISVAPSDNSLPAVSLTTAARYVHISHGRFTLETLKAREAGVSNQALGTESTIVAGMNGFLDRGIATVNKAGDGVVVDTAKAVHANAKDAGITVAKGITITISTTGIEINMTKAGVTEFENEVTVVKDVAQILSSATSGVPGLGWVSGASSGFISLISDVVKLCTTSKGTASFTIPWIGIPSCSGWSISDL
jgi:hypothetical protein